MCVWDDGVVDNDDSSGSDFGLWEDDVAPDHGRPLDVSPSYIADVDAGTGWSRGANKLYGRVRGRGQLESASLASSADVLRVDLPSAQWLCEPH